MDCRPFFSFLVRALLAHRALLVIPGCFALVGVTPAAQDLAGGPPRLRVLHVDDDAPPGGDGARWRSAFRHLQDALSAAAASGGTVLIQVAQGTYHPDRTATFPQGTGYREATFQLLNGVTLRGGYAGRGAPDPDEHDPERFVSILSGDVGTPGDPLDNAYSVVTGSLTDRSAVLEGFTVTDARADGPSSGPRSARRGGGLWCDRGGPVVRACRFVANQADFGAGMYLNDAGDVLVEDCDFEANENLSSNGGGIFSLRTVLEMRRCRFVGNTNLVSGAAFQVQGGDALVADCLVEGNSGSGGIVNVFPSGSTPVQLDMRRCTFRDNRAVDYGITNAIGGALIVQAGATATIRDCEFVGNRADESGGALWTADATLTLLDCSFRDNACADSGGALFVQGSPVEARRCLFAGNRADGTSLDGGGGAVFVENATVLLQDCALTANEAGGRGGGVRVWDDGDVTLVNALLAGNDALQVGGAVAAESNLFVPNTATLVNCTVYGNTSAVRGFEGLLAIGSDLTVRSSIFWENATGGIIASGGTVSVSASIVEGGFPGPGNLDVDPELVDPLGPDELAGTGDEDYGPAGGSPAIDAGDTAAVPAGVVLDLVGAPRIVDGDGSATSEVDIGALEFQPGAPPAVVARSSPQAPRLRRRPRGVRSDASLAELDVDDPHVRATLAVLLASGSARRDARGLLADARVLAVRPLVLGRTRLALDAALLQGLHLQVVLLDAPSTRWADAHPSNVLAPSTSLSR